MCIVIRNLCYCIDLSMDMGPLHFKFLIAMEGEWSSSM